jgi:hypothetical protein
LPHGLILLLFLAGYLVIFTASTGKPKPAVPVAQASISVGLDLGQTGSRPAVDGTPDKRPEVKP